MTAGTPNKKRTLPVVGSSEDIVRGHIEGTRTHDLVFAVVGYIGSGASWVTQKLAEELRAAGYGTRVIKGSELIQRASAQIGIAAEGDLADKYQRVIALQNAGDELRKRFGRSFLAGLAIRALHELRSLDEHEGGQQAFILDSLKHPEEVDALRDVYGRSFYLVSVVCHPDKREKRLAFKFKDGASPEQRATLMRRDQAGSEAHGQHVRKSLHLGDFFIRNDQEDEHELIDQLRRVCDIVMGKGIVRPTRDERGMQAAWSASLRSSCLSRQVGAAILADSGEILATGSNDVPRFGGGLYQDGDEQDHRCFRWTGASPAPQCHNDKSKERIYEEIFESLHAAKALSDVANESFVRQCIEETRIKSLIEFSRAVHAEMDAIISLARKGGASCSGATLYSTTYPCHSCARHIVAAGMQEVVYIEPYAKSLARELHKDSIDDTTDLTSDPKNVPPGKVCFRLFSGVAPRRFAALFEKRGDLKDAQGDFVDADGKRHQDRVFTETFLDFERNIAKRIEAQLSEEAGSHV